MIQFFNITSLIGTLGILIILIQVSRLKKYVQTTSWTLKLIGWSLLLFTQILGLVNVHLLGGGLNWLSVINRVIQLSGIVLLSYSYALMEHVFRHIINKLKVKTPIKP